MRELSPQHRSWRATDIDAPGLGRGKSLSQREAEMGKGGRGGLRLSKDGEMGKLGGDRWTGSGWRGKWRPGFEEEREGAGGGSEEGGKECCAGGARRGESGLMKNEDGRRDAGGWRPPGFEEGRRLGGGNPRRPGGGSLWGGRSPRGGRSPANGGVGGWDAGLEPEDPRLAMWSLAVQVASWAWPLYRGQTRETGLSCPHQELCLPA